MRNLIFIAVVLGASAMVCHGRDLVQSRKSRSVLQFGRMISCATGRNALDYNNYGCWCGRGGEGTPVDAVDRCCLRHDQCYDALLAGTCSGRNIHYWVWYSYSTRRCKQSHGYSDISCGGGSSCEVGLCNCDREAALCFSRVPYNDQYKGYGRCYS